MKLGFIQRIILFLYSKLEMTMEKIIDNKTKKILIIEDDEDVRPFLKRIVERKGYTVITAKDGLEGKGLYSKEHFDLVITDIVMPEMEGIEIIRNLNSDYPQTKIIVITGADFSGIKNYLNNARIFGAHDAFAKPIDQKKLMKSISNLID